MDDSIEHETRRKGGVVSAQRRRLVGASAAGALMSLVDPAIRAGAWAQGSDAPEKKEVKVGFIPLTDCASVVVASVMEFDKKYGVKIVPSKEASWAAVRARRRRESNEARRIRALPLDPPDGMDHAKEETRTRVIAVRELRCQRRYSGFRQRRCVRSRLRCSRAKGMAPAPIFIRVAQ